MRGRNLMVGQRVFNFFMSGNRDEDAFEAVHVRCHIICLERASFDDAVLNGWGVLFFLMEPVVACDAGPVADLLRLNTGIPSTPAGSQKRLGFLAGDLAGFPQGRRPIDDVVDIASRAVVGILANPVKFGARVGDGVNTKDGGFGTTFPYVTPANSGRDSHHTGPGQAGCSGQPDGICPVK